MKKLAPTLCAMALFGLALTSCTTVQVSKQISEAEFTSDVVKTNSFGQASVHIFRNLSGEIEQWYEYFHEVDGKKMVTIIKHPDGSYQHVIHHTYNDFGNIQQMRVFDGSGTLQERKTYSYNEENEWVQTDWLRWDDRRRRWVAGQELTPPEAYLYGTKEKLKTQSP